MMIPTVHMNGDNRQTLIDDNMAAYLAVQPAIDAAVKACPDERNFYPQGEGAIQQAIEEHRRRLELLEAVRMEFEGILVGIQEQ
jgi:hypothetical protein